MKKIVAALTTLIITCTFSAGAFAAPPKHGKGLRQAKALACMALTDEQQKQLRDLYQEFIDDTYEMRADMATLNQQIRMYMDTSDPDPAKLKSMIMEKMDLAANLAVKRMEFALDARKISPELRYMLMGKGLGFGKGPGFGGHGMGHGHYGLLKDLGFNNSPGPLTYGTRMGETLPEKN